MPLENPFRQPHPDLDPDQAPFLEKFAGASEEELKAAGIKKESAGKEITEKDNEPSKNLEDVTSSDEHNAFQSELLTVDGVQIKRGDLEAIKTLKNRLNEELERLGYQPIEFGEGLLEVGSAFPSEIAINEEGDVIELTNRKILKSLEGIKFPRKLRSLDLRTSKVETLTNISLPDSLRRLDISYSSIASLKGIKLPETLETLIISLDQIYDLSLPEDIKKLRIRTEYYYEPALIPIEQQKEIADLRLIYPDCDIEISS